MKKLLPILLIVAQSAWSGIPEKFDKIDCYAAREFITTVQFLRSEKDFGLSEKEIVKAADDVSKGCSNASQRFIKVTKILTKMGIDSRSSLKSALSFVDKDDAYTDAFVEIYKLSYDPKYLDLDPLNSMRISVELASQYEGNIETTIEDFRTLVEYCVSEDQMDLPRPQCAKVAQDIAKIGQDYQSPIAEAFIDFMSFLQEKDAGPGLDRNNALQLAKKVLAFGPKAGLNYEKSFLFAVSKSGLNFSAKDAMKFSEKLAQRSVKLKTPE